MIRATLITIALISLTACETAKGLGSDIQTAGKAVKNTAQSVKNEF